MTLNLQDSIAFISSSKPTNSRFGTGFVIHRDGDRTYLLTCAHVIKDVGGKDCILVEEMQARCVASSDIKGFDLAVLCVDNLLDKQILKLSAGGRKGSEFKSTGFFEYSEEKKRMSEPIEGVLGKQKQVIDSKRRARAWQLKCDENSRLQRGYSGSPVVDSLSEQVIGVVTNMEGGGETGQAISIEALSNIWEAIPPELLNELSASLAHQLPSQKQVFRALTTKLVASSPGFRAVAGTSLVVTFLLLIVRFFGILQPVELWSYDRLIRSRPANDEADERIRIIEITEEDKEKYGKSETVGQASLPDSVYNQLFARLERYDPKTIGLDIYRSFSVQKKADQYEQLQKSLSKNQNLFVVCKVPDSTANINETKEYSPPPEVPEERVGFSDFVEDNDGVLRRHLLRMDLSGLSDNPCPTDYAFNLQLALHYLGRKPKPPKSKDDSIKGVVFTPIGAFTGGYQDVSAGGHQVLLNYRSLKSPSEIARYYKLDEILADRDNKLKEDIQGKIVLIGINDVYDRWSTPYGGKTVPGVFMQAHMVSHILDVANGDRALLWVLPQWGEYLLIWFGAGVGGTLAWFYRSLKPLLIAQITFSGGSVLAGWLFFTIGSCWLPIIPFISASLFSSVGVLIYLKP